MVPQRKILIPDSIRNGWVKIDQNTQLLKTLSEALKKVCFVDLKKFVIVCCQRGTSNEYPKNACFHREISKISGPSCLKLTMSLVKVLLNL